MSTPSEPKLTKFLDRHKPGTVALSGWLQSLGISHDLQKRYRQSHWLESVGTGAFKRPAETIDWQGGLYALQSEAKLPIHVGALTALALQGFGHYVRTGRPTVYLFSPPKTPLPAWYRNYDWQATIVPVRTSILPASLGLTEHPVKDFSIRIATPERAILECLYLAPERLDLVECYQVLEGLANLRPKLLKELLQACTSVKVKRTFVYMAEKAGHAWAPLIELKKLALGTGHRRLVKDGVYIAEHQLTVPQELADLQ